MPIGYDATEGYSVTIDGKTYTIRPNMLKALNRWLEHGDMPGTFLECVLRNDFIGCLRHADADNFENLRAYAAWLYWEAPNSSWGNEATLNAWAASLKMKEVIPC